MRSKSHISEKITVAIALLALSIASCHSDGNSPPIASAKPQEAEIVTVRPLAATSTRQQLPNYVGISRDTVGATAISMTKVVIPPGGAAKAHSHRRYETAIYLLAGRVETRYGAGLRKSVINEAGDFIFIPPDLPHQPRNLSATEPAIAIVARSDPAEQENVELYPSQPE